MNRSAGFPGIGAAAWLVFVTLLSGCDAPEPEPREQIRPVKAVRVTGAGQFRERTFPGRAQPVREVELSFRVSGPLTELPVGIGREVEQGEVVAQIDRRDFELALRNVQAQLENARASQRRAEADFERLTNV
ncbi:MAG: biotin/lipoyl-binding protein, partial [Pseudomonadales bacterium]|nr:biotin/lipoyl-binding protein [Pseudomonadales bacterium]